MAREKAATFIFPHQKCLVSDRTFQDVETGHAHIAGKWMICWQLGISFSLVGSQWGREFRLGDLRFNLACRRSWERELQPLLSIFIWRILRKDRAQNTSFTGCKEVDMH